MFYREVSLLGHKFILKTDTCLTLEQLKNWEREIGDFIDREFKDIQKSIEE